MTMSSRIAVMDAGKIDQIDTPAGIYEFPSSRFVAGFIGSVNLFEGKVTGRDGDEALVEGATGVSMRMRCPQPPAVGSPVAVAVRPEKLRLCDKPREGGVNQLRGVVEDIAYLGGVSKYHVRVTDAQVVAMTLANVHPRTEQALTWGQEVIIEWGPGSGLVLTD